jgi:hypothetical protein
MSRDMIPQYSADVIQEAKEAKGKIRTGLVKWLPRVEVPVENDPIWARWHEEVVFQLDVSDPS